MVAGYQSMASNRPESARENRHSASSWVLPSGRRLIDFVIAGGLAAPVLALALKHVVHVERQRRKVRAL